jgi:hypothetical protein
VDFCFTAKLYLSPGATYCFPKPLQARNYPDLYSATAWLETVFLGVFKFSPVKLGISCPTIRMAANWFRDVEH